MSVHTDEYLLEAYRQAGENARMYATSRFSNLTGFLTYVSVLTAALAFLLSHQKAGASFGWAVLPVAALGIVLAGLFLALEVRHHHWWEYYELTVVAGLEEKMGHAHYPAGLRGGQMRTFVNGGRRPALGLTATRATYGIYLATMAFFALVGAGWLLG